MARNAANIPAGENLEILEPLCAVFRRTLKAHGLKYTPERALILDAVVRMDSVFEAERLILELKKGTFRVSKATVYRTLKLLLEAGILQRVLFDEEQSHFQLVWGRKPQDLLIRVDMREVEEVALPEVAEAVARLCRERGLEVTGHRLMIFARAPGGKG